MSYLIPLASSPSSGNTSGAQTVVLASFPVPAAGKVVRLQANVLGQDGTGASVAFVKNVMVKNVGGTVTIVGSVLDSIPAVLDAALTGTSATFAINGTKIELRVTGIATKNIAWIAQTEIRAS